MRTSETTAAVFAALAKAQGELKAAAKDSNNPAFRSKYADLSSHVDAIRPVAKSHGLATVQELTSDDAGVSVVTRICHASGEWIEFGPLTIPASKHDAHGYGSACSYARRYALSAAFGTVADDDDGNAAVQTKQDASVPAPIGYSKWLEKVQAGAETMDEATFRERYDASEKKYRHYLETTNREAFDAMVEKAKKNRPAAA